MRDIVETFIAGYLDARGNRGSAVRLADGLAVVDYLRPWSRHREIFVWDAAAPAPVEASPKAWVTVFGADAPVAAPAWAGAGRGIAAHEIVMAIDLPIAGNVKEARVERLETPEAIAQFNASGHFLEIPVERGTAVFFAAMVGGEFAAAGRYGRADTATVVVDAMRTREAFRRRGLASALLGAMCREAAAEGAKRMLLIATLEGVDLYRALGFRTLAQVDVYLPV